MTNYPRMGQVAEVQQASPPRLLVWGGVGRFAIAGEFACQLSFDTDAPFDGVILIDRRAAADVAELLRARRAWLAPVADLSGSGLPIADVRCTDASPPSIRKAIEHLLRLVDALGRLPSSVAAATNDETLLLARTYSRGGLLQPVYDGSSPNLLVYPVAGLLETPTTVAERLCQSGWFGRTFFDRLHVCPRCDSSRLNVREECAVCRSPQLSEASFVHHFRCGFQATERQFAVNGALVCPKCRRRLRHFGVDYDRPGVAHACLACEHVDAETAVGFVCVDCGTHSDAAQVAARDWHSYALTAAGEQRLLNGDLRRLRPDVRNDDVVIQSLAEHWMRIQLRYGRPSAVLRIVFARTADVREDQGERFLASARRQAMEIVRGELRDTDLMIETPDGLLVVLPETEAQAANGPRQRLLTRLNALLATDFGVNIELIEPHQMAVSQIAAAQ